MLAPLPSRPQVLCAFKVTLAYHLPCHSLCVPNMRAPGANRAADAASSTQAAHFGAGTGRKYAKGRGMVAAQGAGVQGPQAAGDGGKAASEASGRSAPSGTGSKAS